MAFLDAGGFKHVEEKTIFVAVGVRCIKWMRVVCLRAHIWNRVGDDKWIFFLQRELGSLKT
jgi:hypothetical protein